MLISCGNAQESTIQATYLDKRINLGKQSLKLMIWDTVDEVAQSEQGSPAFRAQAGQERFHALGPIYYRDANGALLVYDITDRESFTKVRHWVKVGASCKPSRWHMLLPVSRDGGLALILLLRDDICMLAR